MAEDLKEQKFKEKCTLWGKYYEKKVFQLVSRFMPNERDDVFDLTLCTDTLHHLPNVEQVLSEMKRVTKGGGCVVVFWGKEK